MTLLGRKPLEICKSTKIRQPDDCCTSPGTSHCRWTCRRPDGAYETVRNNWRFVTVPSPQLRSPQKSTVYPPTSCKSSLFKFTQSREVSDPKGGKSGRELTSMFWRLPTLRMMMKWMPRDGTFYRLLDFSNES